jgi:hypothetical protein
MSKPRKQLGRLLSALSMALVAIALFPKTWASAPAPGYSQFAGCPSPEEATTRRRVANWNAIRNAITEIKVHLRRGAYTIKQKVLVITDDESPSINSSGTFGKGEAADQTLTTNFDISAVSPLQSLSERAEQ